MIRYHLGMVGNVEPDHVRRESDIQGRGFWLNCLSRIYATTGFTGNCTDGFGRRFGSLIEVWSSKEFL